MKNVKKIYILVQKFKCCNFIEEYVDQQKGTFNLEIARAHAKKLIE